MGDVLFTFDVDRQAGDRFDRALTTAEGIASFWTDKPTFPRRSARRSN